MKKHHWLIIALILGATLGSIAHQCEDIALLQQLNTFVFAPIGQIFLRLIFMIVVPMVFTGLFLGVYQLSLGRGLGTIASKTLFFTLISSAASVIIGVSLVALLQPGKSFSISSELLSKAQEQVESIKTNASVAKTLPQALIEIIPKNPMDTAVKALDGEMLSLMFFALMLGIAFCQVYPSRNEEEAQKILLIQLLEQVYNTCMKVVEFAMKLAPYAVFSLIFGTTFKFGHELLYSLLFYVLVVIAGLLIQQMVVYSVLLKLFSRWSPLEFYKKCREVYLYAFATASSNATLPKSLNVAETELKISGPVARFVLTVGSTANQNGTALFEGITVLFLAQVFGVELSFASQVQVVIMSILAGIGTAGVPGGSLPLIVILLQQVGIPAEGIGLILGVDRLLDMCRTTVNVSGDLVIAALVDHKSSKSISA
jgi:DAACS family dicarboxylate/amino acid:cation (Na+ or H+) symporter